MGADTAQDAEHRLHEQRRLDEAALEEMRQVIEVPDVVAFELEPGVVVSAGLQHEFDIPERVAENEIAGAFQVRLLPIEFEILVAVEHREQGEVHRAHVEACDLGLEHLGGPDALLHPHGRRAARGQVDDRVASLLDDRQERGERLRPLVGLSGLRITGMEMHDRGAGLGGADGGLGDLLRGDRQVGRHGGGMDRARDGTCNDDLIGCGHSEFSPSLYFRLYPNGRKRAHRPFRQKTFAANQFEFRKKMRHAREQVNFFKKTLNPVAGSQHQYATRPLWPPDPNGPVRKFPYLIGAAPPIHPASI
jgi:hypothetical protein